MKYFSFALLFFFVTKPCHAASYILIASGAKSESKAGKMMRALKIPGSIGLEKGFPRMMKSDDVVGLKKGLFINVLGFCPVSKRILLPSGKDDGVRTNIDLKHYAYVISMMKSAIPGSYAKKIRDEHPESCPRWIPNAPTDPKRKEAWARIADGTASAVDYYEYGRHAEIEEQALDQADYFYSLSYIKDPDFKDAQAAITKLDFVGARR